MTEEKIIDPDREVEQMVNPNTAYRRRIAEEEAREHRAVFPHAVTQELEKQMQKAKLLRILGAAGRCCVGLVFIGGMARGLMAPAFAVVTAIACAAWGLWSLRRKQYG